MHLLHAQAHPLLVQHPEFALQAVIDLPQSLDFVDDAAEAEGELSLQLLHLFDPLVHAFESLIVRLANVAEA